ncbi:MAG: hypothetical protein J5649_11000 [Lachnospiraceae bacterium]|nr:hypothetical protein [Lachnospiraceae bacterium]
MTLTDIEMTIIRNGPGNEAFSGPLFMLPRRCRGVFRKILFNLIGFLKLFFYYPLLSAEVPKNVLAIWHYDIAGRENAFLPTLRVENDPGSLVGMRMDFPAVIGYHGCSGREDPEGCQCGGTFFGFFDFWH